MTRGKAFPTEKRKRRFVRSTVRSINRVQNTNDQWILTLACGHRAGVIQASHPNHMSAVCPTCSDALQQKQAG